MKTTAKAWIFTAVLILFNIIFFWVKPAGKVLTMVSDVLPIICALLAIIGMYFAVRSFKLYDQTKLAWLFILIGLILYLGGESIYAILEIFLKVDVTEVVPTVADYSWMAGYVPLILGLIMLIYGYKKSGFALGHYKIMALGSLAITAIMGTLIYWLFIPILNDPELSGLAKFTYIYYPVADLFLIVPALILVHITCQFGRGMISRPWRYIAIGFVGMTISDILYSYLSWNNMYGPGNFIDIAWNLGYLLIGLGGLYQKELIEAV
ncbi:MAG: hypothetical protein HY920_03290 [Elusimicrobia bacterium]|nr:hypothetical protein [Elusimicrobiota bacterium]